MDAPLVPQTNSHQHHTTMNYALVRRLPPAFASAETVLAAGDKLTDLIGVALSAEGGHFTIAGAYGGLREQYRTYSGHVATDSIPTADSIRLHGDGADFSGIYISTHGMRCDGRTA